MTGPRRLQLALAVIELLTLAALLGNRFTVDADGWSAVLGPVHGVSYLLLVLLALAARRAAPRARLAALVPGVGGLLSWSMTRRRSPTGPRT